MGEGPNTGQIPFDGGVDEVAIYNYALSRDASHESLCDRD